jgi:tRNA(Ile)-lysidine synthase
MSSKVLEIVSLVECFFEKVLHELSSPPSLLLAISGGVDSCVLLDILTMSGFSERFRVSGVVHVDHGIRAESAEDAEFVARLASQKGLPLFQKKCVPPQTGIESWGRSVRYEFFTEVLEQTTANFVVTAHHLDDEIETFLFRLITGRSTANENGLIREIDLDRKLLRPFISVSKELLTAHAKERNIPYVYDISNQDTSFSRNFIRHKVIPVLEEINPAVKRCLEEFISRSGAEESYLESQAGEYLLTDKLQFDRVPEVLHCRVLRMIAEKQIGVSASWISSRRYQALADMIKVRPGERKQLDMGHKVTVVIDKDIPGILSVRFQK